MTLRVVLEYDEVIDSWAAYCPEMPGINSCGATQEEAASNFKEAAELFFEPSNCISKLNWLKYKDTSWETG